MGWEQELLAAARLARGNAYAPYSHFGVGAAVLAEDGTLFEGCNIENAAYGVSNCAERTALFKAVSDGARRVKAVAVVGGPLGEAATQPCPPCGVCRQALYEFGGPALQVVLEDGQGGFYTRMLGELLPEAFGPDKLD